MISVSAGSLYAFTDKPSKDLEGKQNLSTEPLEDLITNDISNEADLQNFDKYLKSEVL